MAAGSIQSVRGLRIWDSRGRPTLEVEITLADGSIGRGMAPAGASRGSREALELRDGGEPFGGLGVQAALDAIEAEIAPALEGMPVHDQAGIDATLVALDGTPLLGRLGGNTLVATSMAVLKASAAHAGQPVWRWLAGDAEVTLPLPEVQIFGGGAHAGRRIDVQDFLVMPVGASSFDEAMAMCAEVYRAAGELMRARGNPMGVADEGGWWPSFATNEEALEALEAAIDRAGLLDGRMMISLDIAASEFGSRGRYRLGLDATEYDSDGWLEVLLRWIERYPILSVEDPVAEDDDEGMRRFTRAVGTRVQVIGDDYLVTDAQRVRSAAQTGACNAVLIKPNQAGTLSAARAALDAARALGWGRIVSARSGETEDTLIADLAVGWHAGQIKVGSFARSERMAKWNELLRIERALGARARFAGRSALPV